jgi:hypothetical protein
MNELQRLRDRVEQLEEMLGIGRDTTLQIRLRLGLTKCQAKMLGILVKREMVSWEAMHFVLYGDRPDADQPWSEANLRKHIVLLRRRLEPTGIKVEAVYGQGWMLANEHKAKVRELMQ